MGDLEQILDADEANYKEAIRIIGDSATILQDVANLYSLLSDFIKEYGHPRDEIIAALQFLLACRYQLNLGAITALRGHLTDSFSYIRKAIEFCAFANRINNEPRLALIWLSAGDEEKSYKIYRSEFSQKKIFPKNNQKLKVLYDRFDQCSKSIHPSLFSLARHIKVEKTNDLLTINFRVAELLENDLSEPIRTILWIVDIHFKILEVFEEILKEIVDCDRKRWEVWRNGLEAKIEIHKERWKAIILEKRLNS
jgi:hypothetical protein